MRNHWPLINIVNTLWLCFCILLFSKVVLILAGTQWIGKISPEFEGSQMNWIDKNGMFLLSNKQEFGFGFVRTSNDSTLFLLAIVHIESTRNVWTANREFPVSNSDKFVFDEKGNVFLQKGSVLVWSTNTSDMKVSSMELQDNGNLVLLRNDSKIIWQSFDYPTDTLLPMQNFTKGMKLISEPDPNNLTYVLEIESQTGNVILSTGLQSPQPYWSMQKDNRIIVNENGDEVASATLDENSWKFYGKEKSLLWQFIVSDSDAASANSIWIAVLGNDGFITFYNLQNRDSIASSKTTIPKDSCSTPQPCGPYNICSGDKKCSCPSVLSSRRSCEPGFVSPCESKSSIELMKVDDGLNYFALGFLQPSLKTDLIGCKNSCSVNCSCLAMFFQKSSGNCYLLDRIGSFEKPDNDSGFVSYIKVSRDGSTDTGEKGNKNKQIIVVVIIVIVTLFIISGMIYVGLKNLKKKENPSDSPEEISDDEANFLEGITSMPIRFSYNDLETATSNFTEKLGQGGFGSVYKGVLKDGTQIAVKQLEGIGQGKKEFRVEVSVIGSIHHHHLVRLKGFCAEGSHKLLVYEYMENGSLDKWIFKKNKEELPLDWNTRYNIAVGTAKGLAYLHEDCDSKIVHCDIKPENVLLDNNFEAKVSDFGLAKLMNREQSHVFTTMRGTRGYLAPEWITNYAISEKSDVYSYGMVLLEIIGGRKNYDPKENSEKSHFPSFAYKMMEQGKMENVIDSEVKMIENDVRVEIALNVAFWCIQEDMSLRPSMNKVVQMLEGLCDVPKLPNVSPLGSHFYSNFLRPTSESGTSSEPTDGNSDAYLSAVRLSGPR